MNPTASLAWLLKPPPPQNAWRYADAPGHVESYFIRANDPKRARALWLKTTVLAPIDGEPVAESWFIWFDGERSSGDSPTLAHKDTYPLREATFRNAGKDIDIRVGAFDVSLRDEGHARGRVRTKAGVEASFDIRWVRTPSAIAAPSALYPPMLRESPVIKFKANAPFPWLALAGTVTVAGEEISVDGWTASQGHNWGKEYLFDYRWSQCFFPATDGQPAGFVDCGAGRLRVGGRTTPPLAAMVVRRGDREHRFAALFRLWRRDLAFSRDRFTLTMRNDEAEARLRCDAIGRPMACLGYQNPSGVMTYCLNSKLADVLLEVHVRGEAPFTYRSAHCGAYEYISRDHDPRFTVV